jgi:Fur family ferric uptake transcriptional regulator
VGAPVDRVALLRRHGVRVTAERVVSCGAVSDRSHSAPAMLAAVVWSEICAVSLQAVQDALVTLTDRSTSGAFGPRGRRRAARTGSTPTRHHLVSGRRRAARTGSTPTRHHLVCRTRGQVSMRLGRRQGTVSASGRELGIGHRRSPGHPLGTMSRLRPAGAVWTGG